MLFMEYSHYIFADLSNITFLWPSLKFFLARLQGHRYGAGNFFQNTIPTSSLLATLLSGLPTCSYNELS